VESFPIFIVALRLRARKIKWNSMEVAGITPTPSNIITISGHSILTDYHLVTETQVANTSTARINDQAIQNSSALFKCLESSVAGDLTSTIFTQSGNLPEDEDGIKLFILITSFTTVASIQLSMVSFNNILNFNLTPHKFSIPTINSKLVNFFTIATTKTCTLMDVERIQHTLYVYV